MTRSAKLSVAFLAAAAFRAVAVSHADRPVRLDFVPDRHLARHCDDSGQSWRPESPAADERRHDVDIRGASPDEHAVFARYDPLHAPVADDGDDGFDSSFAGKQPADRISTHGEFNSPRGCRGTFGSVGTADATRIEADFTGTDCQLATFSGRMVLMKQ